MFQIVFNKILEKDDFFSVFKNWYLIDFILN